MDNPKSGSTSWTPDYTHINPKLVEEFKKIDLEVKSGSAVLLHSALVHCGYSNHTKGHVRITVTERFNPLKRLPFLQDEKATLKVPYVGVDYNAIKD